MSPITALSILAFASAALASPAHGHGHARHHHKPSGYSAAPYGTVNGTGTYGSGTGFATGSTASATDVSSDAPTNYAPSAVGPATASESAVTTYTSVQTYYNAASGTICTTDVTVTSKTKVYVTVTVPAPEESSSDVESAIEASSSRQRTTVQITKTVTQTHTTFPTANSTSEAGPIGSGSSAASVESSSSTVPVYGSISLTYSTPSETPSTSSTEAAPVETSSSVAPPAYSAPTSTSSTEAAPVSESSSTASVIMTYSEANKGVAASSTSSAAPAYSSASSSTGKRGVAYNDAALTDCFLNKPAVSWAYNWGSASQGLNKAYAYIPMLWSTTSDFTGYWDTNAKAALAAGSTHMFSFNEPDLSSQANLSPQDAAAGFKKYMQPYAGQAKLCAPSVTNGGGSMGLTWLSEFISACDGCTIDCVNIHWYDSAANTDYFKDHVKNATDISGGKQVFVSEFGATGSDDQISTFLQDVMPWMDSQSYVEGYAYFMVADGKLVSGTEPSTYGAVYAGSS